MDWYKTVKDFYDSNCYTKENVKVYVVKNKITSEQYTEITGDNYAA